MPRRGKNAGLGREETLAKSERWLAEAAELELSAAGAVADVNDVSELDAGMVRDVARLHALDGSSCAANDPWVWARRVVSARRVIATFEEVTRLGPVACGPGRSLSAMGRLHASLAELRGHLMVFVVEDEAVAAHLSESCARQSPWSREPRANTGPSSDSRLSVAWIGTLSGAQPRAGACWSKGRARSSRACARSRRRWARSGRPRSSASNAL